MTKLKQIGPVARELGINPKTIRYYEEIGLIPPAQRSESGYRVYGQADIDRIAFILRARELDFSLDDIGEILALREGGEAPCLYVTDLVRKQLAVIDAKIAALNQLREELEDVQRQAETI
ncbi:MAG TPA: heavy metal-responsive transcriptional regulator, partial [Anaerolineae bacterium]|nr:heavy metal-responsive transcriptional regulator [Anaerolineae bacterium]